MAKSTPCESCRNYHSYIDAIEAMGGLPTVTAVEGGRYHTFAAMVQIEAEHYKHTVQIVLHGSCVAALKGA